MDYSHMTAAELSNIAKEKGIKKTSSMKKQELLDALENLEKELAAAVLELESAADSQKEAAESEYSGSEKAESGDAVN